MHHNLEVAKTYGGEWHQGKRPSCYRCGGWGREPHQLSRWLGWLAKAGIGGITNEAMGRGAPTNSLMLAAKASLCVYGCDEICRRAAEANESRSRVTWQCNRHLIIMQGHFKRQHCGYNRMTFDYLLGILTLKSVYRGLANMPYSIYASG